MEKYVLQPDEAILFEDDVSIVESKTNDHIILTNLNVVIESTEKKVFKKGNTAVTVFPVTEIKVYKEKPQVVHKKEVVTIFLAMGEITMSFDSLFKATTFTTKITELITGKGVGARGAEKVKGAIGLIDDALGINTMGTVSSVLENGIVKTLFKGTGSPVAKTSKVTGKAETIGAVAAGASAVIQAATGKAQVTDAATTPVAPAPAVAEMPFDQRVESVKKLKELVDMGILTEEEFEAKKKELIGL